METKKDSCPFREALDLMSGKWTMSIINTLTNGKMRFKELERSIPSINTRMLVKELKMLEKSDVIKREAYVTMPPTVECSLTEKGNSLKPVIVMIQSWAVENQ